jgi:hypothetical protein
MSPLASAFMTLCASAMAAGVIWTMVAMVGKNLT